MIIIMMIIAFLVIIIYEVPNLMQKQQWKELIAFSVLTLISIGLSFAYYLDLPVPNPTRVFHIIFGPISGLVRQSLS